MKKDGISAGTIVIPYTRTMPIATFHQIDESLPDMFVRVKKHKDLNVWYSECADGLAGTANPLTSGNGLIVFVPRQLKINEVVRIVSVFPNGNAAKGAIIKADGDFQTPFDYELANSSGA